MLGAARDLIEEGGFYALTVDGLVTRSGISKATIYRWWENRAAVALDVLVLAFDPPGVVTARGAGIARVRAFVHREAKYLRGPAGPIIGGLLADAQRVPDRARTFERRYLSPRREEFRQHVGRATAEGALPADTDPDVLFDVVQGGLYMELLLHRGGLDRRSVDRLLDQLL